MLLASVSLSSFYSVVKRSTAASFGLLRNNSENVCSGQSNAGLSISGAEQRPEQRPEQGPEQSTNVVLTNQTSERNQCLQGPCSKSNSELSCEVRYLPERKRYSLLPLTPRDFTGILTASDNVFHFESRNGSGAKLELDFDPEQSIINYQIGDSFWDHGMSWCVIESNGERHYFTSDLPPERIKNSEKSSDSAQPGKTDNLDSTIALYQALTDRYLK